MGKINILDSSIYNRIAAGEVVERPSSVVKELFENCIDAEATEIEIHIKNGGIENITIIDNGSGILESDLDKIFLPHATSKVSSVMDLDNILTLGFRGEALSSISSVSKVEITTKTENDKLAIKAFYENGCFTSKAYTSANRGSAISINNLFYNTPARAKFLKAAKSEEGFITALVAKLILSNNTTKISYFINGKIKYKFNGLGLKNAIECVYGVDFIPKLMAINVDKAEHKISGYISLPNDCKSTRQHQVFTLNGRLITNSNISTAIYKGYGNSLFKGNHPMFFLNMTMPFDEIDINVTPNKSDVRFLNADKIFSFLYHSVNEALNKNYIQKQSVFKEDMATLPQAQITFENELMENFEQKKSTSSDLNKPKTTLLDEKINMKNNYDEDRKAIFEKLTNFYKENSSVLNEKISDNKNIITNNSTTLDTHKIENNGNKDNVAYSEFNKYKCSSETRNDSVNNNKNIKLDESETKALKELSDSVYKKSFKVAESDNLSKIISYGKDEKNQIASASCNSESDNINHTNNSTHNTYIDYKRHDFNVLGCVFSTYLLIENKDKLIYVDIHAANERLLYDKLIKMFDNNSNQSQSLLIPQVINLTYDECFYIFNIIKDLNKIGFDIEEFGNNSIKINAIPLSLVNMNLESFIYDLIKEKTTKLSVLLSEKIASIACKNSIKAGDNLTKAQIDMMVYKLFIANDLPLQCPHGRPTYYTITKSELEKKFKR